MKILVNTGNQFLGDIIFASSIADQLKLEDPTSEIDFLIRFTQPVTILRNNPNIGKVFWHQSMVDINSYDDVINLNNTNKRVTPPRQFQMEAGVKSPTDQYHIIVSDEVRAMAKHMVDAGRRNTDKPIIGFQQNWLDRAFAYTHEEYKIGNNVPDLGYGGRKRDIDRILVTLSNDMVMVPLGMPPGVKQTDPGTGNPLEFETMCGLMEQCDWVVGCEGGILNFAAGVGTRTITDMSACWMFYGPNGLFSKNKDPLLGGAKYFPGAGHIHLNPYLDDDGVIEAIQEAIL